MIQRFQITSLHTTTDAKLQSYITKKIGQLDRYVPRQARGSAHAEVRLKQAESTHASQPDKRCTCEVTLHLPHKIINVSESTLNMYAAVDIVEAKLRGQIRAYKQLHAESSMRRRLAQRLLKRPRA